MPGIDKPPARMRAAYASIYESVRKGSKSVLFQGKLSSSYRKAALEFVRSLPSPNRASANDMVLVAWELLTGLLEWGYHITSPSGKPMHQYARTIVKLGEVSGADPSLSSLTQRRQKFLEDLARRLPPPPRIRPATIPRRRARPKRRRPMQRFYLGVPRSAKYRSVRAAVEDYFTSRAFRKTELSYEASASLTPAEILDVLRQCSFGVFDISEKSPNTLLEIGAMFGLGKFVILLARWPKASPIPADLLGHEILGYTRSTQLRKGLARYFRRLKRSLAQQQTLVPGQGVRPRA